MCKDLYYDQRSGVTGRSRPMDLKDPRSQWHMARSFAGPDLGDVEYSDPYRIILMMSS